ncbi:hypothetical protein ECA02_33960 [Enterococcus casseliflavus]|nr:hypothetical protein ECA02_33960 [Enterococcus casseliflavus]
MPERLSDYLFKPSFAWLVNSISTIILYLFFTIINCSLKIKTIVIISDTFS